MTMGEDLVRDRDAGVLTGVCTGLARYTGTDPVVWRVAFALTGLAGGAGVLLYVGAWLLMRDPTGGPAMFEQLLNRSIPGRAVPALLAVSLVLLTAVSLVGGIGWGTLVLATPLILGLLSAHNRGVHVQRMFRDLPGLLRPNTPPPSAPAPEPAPRYFNPSQPWAHAPSGPVDLAVVGGAGPAGPGGGSESDADGEEAEETEEPEEPAVDRTGSRPGPDCGPPRRVRRARGVRLFSFAFWGTVAAAGAVVLAVGGSAGAALLGPETGPFFLGGVVVLVGVLLVVGTWFGDSRGLVGAGAAAVLATVAVSATDLTEMRFGDAQWRPATVAQASAEHRLTVGSALLDLTRLELEPGERVDVAASVDFGSVHVLVPPDARVVVNGEAEFGEIAVDGWQRSGTRLEIANTFEPVRSDGSGDAPTLVVDLDSYVGGWEVRREAA